MNTTTVSGLLLSQTTKALRVRLDGATDDVWLPRSQVSGLELTSDSPDRHDPGYVETYLTASIPMWLAKTLPWNRVTAWATRPY